MPFPVLIQLGTVAASITHVKLQACDSGCTSCTDISGSEDVLVSAFYPSGSIINNVPNGTSAIKVLALDSSCSASAIQCTPISLAQVFSPTGSKDDTFNIGSGFNKDVYATKIDSSGKVLVGGFFSTYSGSTENGIVRLNTDGTKDATFNTGTGFSASFGAIIYSINQDSNQKIYAGGYFTSYSGSSQNYLIRLNSDGTKDTTFDIGTGFDNEVYEIQIDSNGKIYACGQFTSYSGSSQNFLVRLNSDGTKDTAFNIGTGFNAQVYSIQIDSNGKILAGGNFTSYSGSSQTRLVRLNTDGTKDTTFNIGSGFNSEVVSIAANSNGKIYVGGFFTTYSGSTENRLVRLNTDGTKDTAFNIGTGFNSTEVGYIAIDSSGKVLAGGSYTTYSGSTQNRLVRLNTDGTKDTTFDIGTGFDAQVYSISIEPFGKIIVGGNYTTYKGLTQTRLIRLI